MNYCICLNKRDPRPINHSPPLLNECCPLINATHVCNSKNIDKHHLWTSALPLNNMTLKKHLSYSTALIWRSLHPNATTSCRLGSRQQDWLTFLKLSCGCYHFLDKDKSYVTQKCSWISEMSQMVCKLDSRLRVPGSSLIRGVVFLSEASLHQEVYLMLNCWSYVPCKMLCERWG